MATVIIVSIEYIQTLHPQEGKTNKRILLEKYRVIREQLISILTESEVTHTQLMEELYARVHTTFQGGIQWYGETVKLDLEARNIIERSDCKPVTYRLKRK